jgi:hypothetical protein
MFGADVPFGWDFGALGGQALLMVASHPIEQLANAYGRGLTLLCLLNSDRISDFGYRISDLGRRYTEKTSRP